MTWRSFVEYVTMRELGQTDATYRGYDLDNLNGSLPGKMLDLAFDRMGFDQKRTARPFVLPLVAKHLREAGYTVTDLDRLASLMRAWFIWDRLRKRDLVRWPRRIDLTDLTSLI